VPKGQLRVFLANYETFDEFAVMVPNRLAGVLKSDDELDLSGNSSAAA